MAHRTVLKIGSLSRGAHRRVKNAREIVMAALEPNHNVWLPSGRHYIHAVVNAVNHKVEIDALGRSCLISRVLSHGSGSRVGIRRIVTEYAVFGLIAQASVQRQRHMTVVAIADGHHNAPRRHLGAIYGEVSHWVLRAHGDALLRGCTGENGRTHARFAGDRVRSCCRGWYGVGETVHTSAAGAARSTQSTFRHVSRGAAESGVAVVGGGPGHREGCRGKLRQGYRLAVIVFHGEMNCWTLSSSCIRNTCNGKVYSRQQRVGVLRIRLGCV